MYSRIAGVLMPIFAVALIGTAVWGYQENQEKNSVLIKAENQYQRAFHDLNYRVDHLQDELGKSLAISSRQQLSPSLTNVWRLAYAAQSDVGQLPLTLMPFNKTEEFLSNIANFTHQIAFRDLEDKPLTDKEWSTLQKLYKQSNTVQQDLQKVQTKVIQNNLRWMDVEMALAMDDKQVDNTIIDGLKTIDKTVKGYDNNWETTGGGIQNRQKKIKIQGEKVSPEKARKNALQFLDIKNPGQIDVNKNGSGLKYDSYSVSIELPEKKENINLDVTQTGGEVVWFIKNRDVKNTQLDLSQASEKALAFLKKHDYDSMAPSMSNQYDNVGVFTFVKEQGNVRIYPDEVTVKVALDNGEIIGFQSTQFLAHHLPRKINMSPKLKESEARKKLNGRLKVQESRLAVIENKMGKEVLCYEFMGTLGNNTYRVYINANNGDEEEIEKLKS